MGAVFRSVLTALLIAGAAGIQYAKLQLENSAQEKIFRAQPNIPQAVLADNAGLISGTVGAGMGTGIGKTVQVQDGSAFVRFKVTLCDGDGKPFSEKLADLQEELAQIEEIHSPDSPSEQAFGEAVYLMHNKMNQMNAKAYVARYVIFRGTEGQFKDNYTTEDVLDMMNSGQITQLFDENGDEDHSEDAAENGFYRATDPEDKYSWTFTYKQAVGKGGSCTLYDSFIVPDDWVEELTYFDGYYRKDGEFTPVSLYITNDELLDGGIQLKVTAEIVDSEGFDLPLGAFLAAENAANKQTDISAQSGEK